MDPCGSRSERLANGCFTRLCNEMVFVSTPRPNLHLCPAFPLYPVFRIRNHDSPTQCRRTLCRILQFRFPNPEIPNQERDWMPNSCMHCISGGSRIQTYFSKIVFYILYCVVPFLYLLSYNMIWWLVRICLSLAMIQKSLTYWLGLLSLLPMWWRAFECGVVVV